MRKHSFLLGIFLLIAPLLISLPFIFFVLPVKIGKAKKIETSPNFSQATSTAVLSESTSSSNVSTDSAELEARKIRGTITVALLGDSMVDTLGRDLKTLQSFLNSFYPDVSFKLINYGVGASNAEEALARIDQEYFYQNEKIPALIALRPHIVIIESFAYNHPPPTDAGRTQRLTTLENLVSQIKEGTGAEILMLATIAPNDQIYALGAPGINWSPERRKKEAEDVRTFLKDAIKFVQESQLPLINAYKASLDQVGSGEKVYINETDHIHPSPLGVKLVSSLVAQRIHSLGLVDKILSK